MPGRSRPTGRALAGDERTERARASVNYGRVEVREPERPQPKPVPITLVEMVAQDETAADGSVDLPADVSSGRVRLESVCYDKGKARGANT
jgi:hypothetical protein